MSVTSPLPQHIAIIMDGNGRWAKRRLMPRALGHRAGAKSVRRAIDFCSQRGISILSLFALSVENFLNRPQDEVQFLVSLLSELFEKNIDELHSKNVCVRVIGDISVFPLEVQTQMKRGIQRTKDNTGLTLVFAINYSGRWDILQAAQEFAKAVQAQTINNTLATEKDFSQFLCLSDLPEPDLFIRTSGEQRISNFFLWQLAYTELFFTDTFWPDFDEHTFDEALKAYQKRERRFGLTGEQVKTSS